MNEDASNRDVHRVTCAGCRDVAGRDDLERFVHHDRTGLMYDMRGGAPGDEVWVHPLWGCLSAACWAGFARVLGRRIEELDAGGLYEDVVDGVHRRLREAITDAARLDELVVGWNRVVDGVDGGTLELVLADPGRDEGNVEALPSEIQVFEAMRPGTLTEAFGRSVSAVGVPAGERAEALGRMAEKLVCLWADQPEDREPREAAASG